MDWAPASGSEARERGTGDPGTGAVSGGKVDTTAMDVDADADADADASLSTALRSEKMLSVDWAPEE